MGSYHPAHLRADLSQMRDLRLDDVLVALQENDFIYFPGKLQYTPQIAQELGLRPLAIFWGALNLFGGGRSSQFLLENPAGFQVARDGGHLPAGCYVNPLCLRRIQEMIDTAALRGFAGYFVDEPTPLRECYCLACRARFAEWYAADLFLAPPEQREEFRQRCTIHYVDQIARYCKENHPQLETITCLMPHDDSMWQATAALPALDNLGTDLYWVNDDRDVQEMLPAVQRLASLCAASGKQHHEWLQCWGVQRGREPRITAQGQVLLRAQPDALYVWAWNAQAGTAETCADPQTAWRAAADILRAAKNSTEGN
jgi:hypothetical protein